MTQPKLLTTILLSVTILTIQNHKLFSQDAESKDGFKFGGAMRFNVANTSYESDATALNTYTTWDTWFINVDGSMKGLDLSFQYRFYPTFATHFIHHGWIGYNFNDKVYMKLGVSQVPFGITKFASHSWWFQGPYYVGLEDDYDMGIKFDLNFIKNLDLAIAYYRQSEPEGPVYGGTTTFGNSGPGRYSYDLTTGHIYTNDNVVYSNGNNYNGQDTTFYESVRELNHINIRAAYHLNDNIEIGASAQIGQNYNDYMDSYKWSTAFAGHVVADFANFNFKGELVSYNYSAQGAMEIKNYSNGQPTTSYTTYDLETIQMGAYGSNYQVATKAIMYVAGLAYNIKVDWGPIDLIQPYLDYSFIDKSNVDFYDTHHLVPGVHVKAGPIYSYIDYGMGKNQPWLTNNFGIGLDKGIKDAQWNKRFNINIGYYF